ncbi:MULTISPECIES: hypothetical protein [unclassified Bradyrhizobium]|uniref:lipopolysaccharide biosynthesis protein n=1 Tax=unclassified Bradyrhizobium TaxID=2631580 RepID=UPI001FF9F109|nr:MULTISPECIES: hypothetical protein [unclassified Bradyrhizobium]MCK1269272.1 hypothetical protein [Bradyrhizobium sp. 84]MCK1374978.1 hypothetical protein [Bradyrhizobium sp. 49]MCK1417854.1 hypothetical protein [Bradyrhizobium sp. CW4]MCK1426339.1 hypothetical protein [Bradyrhizobium sp. 87]
MLSAIPTYFTFADFGFTMAAKNVMTIKVAAGDIRGALVIYQSIFLLLGIIVVTILLLLLLLLSTIPLGEFFVLGPVTEQAGKSVLFLLASNVLLTQYFLLMAGGLRCIGRTTEEVVWGASARLMEGAITALAASFSRDIVVAGIAIVVIRLTFNFATWARLKFLERRLVMGWRFASFEEAKRLFHPSLSFMLVSLGQALTIQGPVLILGVVGTPFQVVVFSTTRTLARLGTAAANMINFALTPEYSRLFGLQQLRQFARLTRIHLRITVVLCAGYFIFLGTAGDWIIAFWTGGKVMVDKGFFIAMLLAVTAEMIWSAELMPLASINRHTTVSRAFSSLSVIGLILSYLAGQRYGNLIAIVAPLLAIHSALAIFAAIQLRTFWHTHLLGDEAQPPPSAQ